MILGSNLGQGIGGFSDTAGIFNRTRKLAERQP